METRREKAEKLLKAHASVVADLHKSLEELQDPNDHESRAGLGKLLAAHKDALGALSEGGPLFVPPHP